MKFVKKHKNMVIIGLMAIAILLAVLILRETVNFDETTAVYGNRLDGIEKVKITEEQEKNIKDALKETTKSVSVRVAGKLVNIIIVTNEGITLDIAKNMGNISLEKFSDEQKQFYDFQFLIDNDENKDQFPIIGYKQHSRTEINWTKDRQKTES